MQSKDYVVYILHCLETLNKLSLCKEEIDSNCVFPVSQSKLDEHEKCYEDAKAFYEAVDKCSSNGNKNETQACECFGKLNLDDMLVKIGNCNPKDDEKKATQEKKKCKNSKSTNKQFLRFLIFWHRDQWM